MMTGIGKPTTRWDTLSGRTEGRAAGGMGDTIRRPLVCAGAFLDSRLEPASNATARTIFRRRSGVLRRERSVAPSREISWPPHRH
jgi:hypothetical protein